MTFQGLLHVPLFWLHVFHITPSGILKELKISQRCQGQLAACLT